MENSLRDKNILENVKIEKTHQREDRILHDVSVNKNQIERLGGCLDDGPWYMHFWKKDTDSAVVVFKDKTFQIKTSDKATWLDAIEYGTSNGIPEARLNFEIR